MEATSDYLIVSDLHLRGGFNNPTEGLYHYDEEFADFLRYYRLHRTPARPWTLIIGGDFMETSCTSTWRNGGYPLFPAPRRRVWSELR